MQEDVLECLLCFTKYSFVDAEKGRYYLETRICENCYTAGQHQKRRVWCFGKRQKDSEPGYSKQNVACQKLCPDRNICIQFVKEKR